MTAATIRAARRWGRRAAATAALTFLTYHPLLAILALGWRQGVTAAAAGAAPARRSGLRGLVASGGALAADGARGALALAAGTAPFTLVWATAWWAGWENSFNKGYEQSWVGPSLGLLGVAIALPLLARLPFAMAHVAVTRQVSAAFDVARGYALMRAAGWRYVLLSAGWVAAATPLFGLKALPVFVEHIVPGFADRSAEEVRAFAEAWRFWTAVYTVIVMGALAHWTGRLYAFSAARVALQTPAKDAPRDWAACLSQGAEALARGAALAAIWLTLVAQIYVGQFLNHSWAAWMNPPLIGSPWTPVLGG